MTLQINANDIEHAITLVGNDLATTVMWLNNFSKHWRTLDKEALMPDEQEVEKFYDMLEKHDKLSKDLIVLIKAYNKSYKEETGIDTIKYHFILKQFEKLEKERAR
jgi:hypothetical protein